MYVKALDRRHLLERSLQPSAIWSILARSCPIYSETLPCSVLHWNFPSVDTHGARRPNLTELPVSTYLDIFGRVVA